MTTNRAATVNHDIVDDVPAARFLDHTKSFTVAEP